MRRFHLGICAIAMTAAIAACGSSDNFAGSGGGSNGNSTGAGNSGPTAEQACTDLGTATCARLDGCSAGLGSTVAFGDPTTCQTRGVASCVLSLSASMTSSTPAALEACATAVGSESCEAFWDGEAPSACVPTAGMLGDGAPCGADAQCSSTFCQPSMGSFCGTCAPLPAVGSTCSAGAGCGRGLFCDIPSGTAGTCKAPVESGGACLRALECTAGTTCVGANAMMSTMGTCQTMGSTAGAACQATNATAATCDPHFGLYCGADSMCHAATLSGAGMTCGVIGSGATAIVAACKGGSLCVVAMGKATGKCVAPAADGAACDPAMGPPCLSPARCLNSVCTQPDATKCQ